MEENVVKTEVEEVVQEQEVTQPDTTESTPETGEKSGVQKRIDQLTARAKSAEEEARANKEKLRLLEEQQFMGRAAQPQAPNLFQAEAEDDFVLDPDTDRAITKKATAIAKQLIGQKEFELSFLANERSVFSKHPEMLNDDGTYNMSNAKVRKYVTIGQKYPQLKTMVDGPVVAMRMMEADDFETRVAEERVKAAEAAKVGELSRQKTINASSTGASTTSRSSGTPSTKLTEKQKIIARKMGLSDEEYMKFGGSKQIDVNSGAAKRRSK